ncbi:acyl-CoA desaturase, partial [Kibdelosporangium lantanae]
MTTTLDKSSEDQASPGGPKPLFEGKRNMATQIAVYAFIILPFVALVAAVPFVWGWGLTWVDVILFVVFYTITLLGVTVGYHRLFTHNSYKAKRPMRIALAIAGSLGVQSPPITWVADHRRHHAFSDRDGDHH